MTPDEELDHLDVELERLQSEVLCTPGILRLSDQCLRRCSKWKWEQHGWTVSDGEACGIMNGGDRARRKALLSVLKRRVCGIEFDNSLKRLEVVRGPAKSDES